MGLGQRLWRRCATPLSDNPGRVAESAGAGSTTRAVIDAGSTGGIFALCLAIACAVMYRLGSHIIARRPNVRQLWQLLQCVLVGKRQCSSWLLCWRLGDRQRYFLTITFFTTCLNPPVQATIV